MRIPSNLCVDIKQFFVVELHKLYPKEEAEALFYWSAEEILSLSRASIIALPNLRVGESDLLIFFKTIKRLTKAEPIQYIFRKAYFANLILEVSESVLIPRPETEELVGLLAKDIEKYRRVKGNTLRLWDVGTGSGCIALSLAQANPNIEVWASDFSEDALNIARKNMQLNGGEKNFPKVNFIKHDMLNDNALEGKWDIVVSNPPYVLESEKALMSDNVLRYEPASALYVSDENPLLYYKALAEIASENLATNGVLWAEINENKGEELKKLFKSAGYESVDVIQDFRSRDRFIRVGAKKQK